MCAAKCKAKSKSPTPYVLVLCVQKVKYKIEGKFLRLCVGEWRVSSSSGSFIKVSCLLRNYVLGGGGLGLLWLMRSSLLVCELGSSGKDVEVVFWG